MSEDIENKQSLKEYFVQIGKSVVDNDNSMTIPIFTGGDNDYNNIIYSAAIAFLSMNMAKEKKNNEEYKHYSLMFDELKNEHFSEFSSDELAIYLTLYLQFKRRYLNKIFSSAEEEDLQELNDPHNRFVLTRDDNGHVKPIINSAKPSINDNMSKRDRIRRRHRAGLQNQPDTISVTLINSFVHVRIRRPTRFELINLINSIEKELRHYGERWAVNSINLERAGIAKIMVDFFIGLIQYHSVEGILDYNELKSILLANDIDSIAITLLEAGSPNGVYYNMTCLANKCHYNEVKLYDPHDLYVELTGDLDDDQREFLSVIKNTGKKTSVEKIRSYQNRYKWKNKPVEMSEKLYNTLDGDTDSKAYGEVNIKIPTMDIYFSAFDRMAEKYNPTIQQYALDYPDVKMFRKKRAEFLGSIRMGDYIHWIDNYTIYADKDIEDSADVVESREDDHRGFEDGMLDIFSEDDELYWKVFGKIMTTVPFMTHTLVGFADSQCSSCGGVGGQEKDKDGKVIDVHPLVKSSGFTPIDPVLNFFDLTRMRIEGMGEAQRLQEEIIS